MVATPWRVFWESILRNIAALSSTPAISVQQQRAERENSSLAADVAAWKQTHEQIQGNTWSAQETHIKEWLLWCSWGCCSKCNTMYQRTLEEPELRDPSKSRASLQKQCYACEKHPDQLPTRLDASTWPQALRKLDDRILFALRPVILHQGAPAKHPHGYKRKAQLSRVSWPETNVEHRLRELDASLLARGLAAYDCLREMSPVYNAWLEAMNNALATQACKSMYPEVLSEPYLEAALWPVLYFRKELCESHCWAPANWTRPFEIAGGDRQKPTEQNLTSAKAMFVHKLTSLNAEYNGRYDLLQFQFDRHVYRTVSAKARVAEANGFDSHLTFQHQHWTPAFWQRHHRILLDLTAQLGFPDLFLTVSPYEWTFPYPYWVRKTHQILGKGPTECAGPEVLSVAHALHQLCAGFLAGKTGHKPWKSHLFCDKSGNEKGSVKGFFGRFEFQEGGQEQIHGRGRGSIHLHCLFWFQCVRSVQLERLVSAHIPAHDAEVAVLAARVLRGKQCKAPVKQYPSEYRWSHVHARWMLCLHVCADFLNANLRPFVVSLLRILRCSQDVQWWQSDAALLRYVSGYVSKYAEHWRDSWLSEASSPIAAALNVCRWWHPCEAEMVMTLARESMVLMSCDHKDYRVPSFKQGEDKVLYLYRRRLPSEEHWTCLEWLRSYTITGTEIAGNVRAHLRRSKTRMAVGVWYHDFPKDEFFWGWLCMNVSHRLFNELLHADMWKVAPKYRFFTAALNLAPQSWDSAEWIRSYLQLHGDRETWIRTKISDVTARKELVRLQISGSIPRYGDLGSNVISNVILSNTQLAFVDGCMMDVQLRLEIDMLLPEARKHWRPRFLTGGPGSGKTFAILAFLRKAACENLKCLVLSPTGKLACSVPVSPNVESMTYHRAFGLYGDGDTDRSAFVGSFDVWILGEVGMISKHHLDFMLQMWLSLDRFPTFVLEGDLAQLPPAVKDVFEADVRRARFWPLLREFTLHSQFRSTDSGLLEFARMIRDCQPSNHVVSSFCQEVTIASTVSPEALAAVWAWDPSTFILCATTATVDTVNQIALTHFGSDWLGEVPIWRLLDGVPHVEKQWLRRGSAVMITRNGDFDYGICNGAVGEVLALVCGGIVVKLQSEILCLHLRTEWIGNRLSVGFDVTLGYACTVHKAEGCTLESCTIVFEDFAPLGWGYTAVTRAKSKARLRIIGQPSSWHFRPRCFKSS